MNNTKTSTEKRASWSNRLSFILVTAGAAVGLGNLWKFPYITWKNGGGLFVIVYFVCIIVVGLPIMILEIFMGKYTQANPYRTFKILDHTYSPFRFVGIMCVLSALTVLSYYSVVSGWSLEYQVKSMKQDFQSVPIDKMYTLLHNQAVTLQENHDEHDNSQDKPVTKKQIIETIYTSNAPLPLSIKTQILDEMFTSPMDYVTKKNLLQDAGLLNNLANTNKASILKYFNEVRPYLNDKLKAANPKKWHEWRQKAFLTKANQHNNIKWLQKSFAPSYFTQLFHDFLGNHKKILLWHFTIMLVIALILMQGIHKGIEIFTKYSMILLILLMVALSIHSLKIDTHNYGLNLLMHGNPNKFTWTSILEALGHAFFTLSIGMGAIITYGSYLDKKEDCVKNAFWIVVVDTGIAIMACMILFPLLFVHGMENHDIGLGLLFTALPIEFNHLPGGNYLAMLFYSLVLVAAITSAISLLEVVVTFFIEEIKVTRNIAVIIATIITFVLGLPSVISTSFLSRADIVASHILLPLGGLATVLFAGYRLNYQILKEEFTQHGYSEKTAHLFQITIRYITPLFILAVFAHLVYGLL